ncbi:D-2-hydroxyacid dehydrogenase [Gorillibacterium timonense]|uniref:D-2-hydroxyacid dehydrogenase n=1 Tax=Gorillibacterium timonense TaxID=1689269 RepID=UPI00071E0FF7|nr:D-2-hydroxyacid dehydrogenase [Gorillibacterium timonense]
MTIKRILYTGTSTPELEEALRTMGKELRLQKATEVTPEDMEWADTYVGSRFPEKAGFGNVRWVHTLSAGVDFFVKDREWPEDILLTRTICSFGRMISEYCLGHLLRHYQRHATFHELQQKARWGGREELPETIRGKRVVVFGTGVIGTEVAQMLSDLGMHVDGVSRSGEAKAPFVTVTKTDACKQVLKRADWVISTLPLTDETERFFNREIFASLDQAGFINVGRGKTVVETDLLDALDRKQLHTAVLDVTVTEPLPQESPLWTHPGVMITPHISAVTPPGEGAECFLSTLKLREEGKLLPNIVDLSRGY